MASLPLGARRLSVSTNSCGECRTCLPEKEKGEGVGMVFARREKEERGGRMEKDSWLAGVDFTCSSGGREGHIMFAREGEGGSDLFYEGHKR